MDKSEYWNIYKNEEKHFYYIGTHLEIISMVRKYLPYREENGKCKYNILDAGCGTGFLTGKLQEFGKIWGVDININALKYAKQRGVMIQKASVESLPFSDNFFDLIISIDVLYHKRVDEKGALGEFFRVLKPGGKLLLKLPAFQLLRGSHDIVAHTKRRYTKTALSKILTEFGFNEIRLTYLASFLFLPALFKRPIERWLSIRPSNAKSDLSSFLRLKIYSCGLLTCRLGYLSCQFQKSPV